LAKELASAYEIGKDLFGHHGSGKTDLASRRREHFADLVDANAIVVDSGPLIALFDRDEALAYRRSTLDREFGGYSLGIPRGRIARRGNAFMSGSSKVANGIASRSASSTKTVS
jgi:hypothetical protein